MTERLANHLTDLLARLRKERAHKVSVEGDELRLLGQAAADSDARAQARECRQEILRVRALIAELESQISGVLDRLDRPDTRSQLLAQRERQREQLETRPKWRNDR